LRQYHERDFFFEFAPSPPGWASQFNEAALRTALARQGQSSPNTVIVPTDTRVYLRLPAIGNAVLIQAAFEESCRILGRAEFLPEQEILDLPIELKTWLRPTVYSFATVPRRFSAKILARWKREREERKTTNVFLFAPTAKHRAAKFTLDRQPS
jgi:hypothetical protein